MGITQGDDNMLSEDQFAEMNARLDETERREKALMQTLRMRLSAVDQKLLEDVRNIGLEHEGRRTMILTELQSLAERVGAFPSQRATMMQDTIKEPIASPTYVPQQAAQTVIPAPAPQPQTQSQQRPNPQPAPNQMRGDWREAAERIRQDIERKLQASNAQHSDPWAEEEAKPARVA